MIDTYLQQLRLPPPDSHKSQNGKTLIIGGSDLFHAASQWSFRVVSRIVDMTFYSSVAENNELLHDAKLYGTDGVIIPRAELVSYLAEVDSVLIGPGLRRDASSRFLPEELAQLRPEDLTVEDWESDTQALVSVLLRSFPHKQWVIDAGALQIAHPEWIPPVAVLTPHKGEFVRLLHNWFGAESSIEKSWKRIEVGLEEIAAAYFQGEESIEPLLLDQSIVENFVRHADLALLQKLGEKNRSTWIVKGQTDLIWNQDECIAVVGGNAGLTKGGTGDILAGLIAGFTAKSSPFAAVGVSSFLNKRAGHELFQERGLMYNSSDLVEQLPLVWHEIL